MPWALGQLDSLDLSSGTTVSHGDLRATGVQDIIPLPNNQALVLLYMDSNPNGLDVWDQWAIIVDLGPPFVAHGPPHHFTFWPSIPLTTFPNGDITGHTFLGLANKIGDTTRYPYTQALFRTGDSISAHTPLVPVPDGGGGFTSGYGKPWFNEPYQGGFPLMIAFNSTDGIALANNHANPSDPDWFFDKGSFTYGPTGQGGLYFLPVYIDPSGLTFGSGATGWQQYVDNTGDGVALQPTLWEPIDETTVLVVGHAWATHGSGLYQTANGPGDDSDWLYPYAQVLSYAGVSLGAGPVLPLLTGYVPNPGLGPSPDLHLRKMADGRFLVLESTFGSNLAALMLSVDDGLNVSIDSQNLFDTNMYPSFDGRIGVDDDYIYQLTDPALGPGAFFVDSVRRYKIHQPSEYVSDSGDWKYIPGAGPFTTFGAHSVVEDGQGCCVSSTGYIYNETPILWRIGPKWQAPIPTEYADVAEHLPASTLTATVIASGTTVENIDETGVVKAPTSSAVLPGTVAVTNGTSLSSCYFIGNMPSSYPLDYNVPSGYINSNGQYLNSSGAHGPYSIPGHPVGAYRSGSLNLFDKGPALTYPGYTDHPGPASYYVTGFDTGLSFGSIRDLGPILNECVPNNLLAGDELSSYLLQDGIIWEYQGQGYVLEGLPADPPDWTLDTHSNICSSPNSKNVYFAAKGQDGLNAVWKWEVSGNFTRLFTTASVDAQLPSSQRLSEVTGIANITAPPPNIPDVLFLAGFPGTGQGYQTDVYQQLAHDYPGLIKGPTIELGTRPILVNEDGSYSTVESMSFQESTGPFAGDEILIPKVLMGGTISQPTLPAFLASDAEAIAHYEATRPGPFGDLDFYGQHLGIWDTPAHASAFANALHLAQEWGYAPQDLGLVLTGLHGSVVQVDFEGNVLHAVGSNANYQGIVQATDHLYWVYGTYGSQNVVRLIDKNDGRLVIDQVVSFPVRLLWSYNYTVIASFPSTGGTTLVSAEQFTQSQPLKVIRVVE